MRVTKPIEAEQTTLLALSYTSGAPVQFVLITPSVAKVG